MSMSATFVQVEEAELAKIKADESMAEALFQEGSAATNAMATFMKLSKTMEERVRGAGPQIMADTLSRMDPRVREMLEQRLGQTTSDMAAGKGGEALLKLMKERGERAAGMKAMAAQRARISLEKEWHGVHYVLCGKAEPDETLMSQAVMGGVEIGEDEGFSGYGPARYFTAQQVRAISEALNRPEVEAEAAARFDAAKMSKLGIYPGWREGDREGVMEALGRLRAFYADAVGKGRAIVTCLV